MFGKVAGLDERAVAVRASEGLDAVVGALRSSKRAQIRRVSMCGTGMGGEGGREEKIDENGPCGSSATRRA